MSRLRFRLRENFNIVVNGVVRGFGGKDQIETHSVNEPKVFNEMSTA